jgi:hypothetical protein
MTKEFRLIDICLPDYFSGSSHTTYAVPIDSKTTIPELYAGVYEEWMHSYDDEISNKEDFDSAFGALIENVKDKSKPLFPDMEDGENDVYAYFIVV